jgi:hypothetical protein
MIVSASRRTDIPAYYSEWLLNRLREGYACVRNPFNPTQVARVSLAPDAVDGIVLWTKNPAPMLPRLGLLKPYPFYFQFTLTAYGNDVERNVPSKNDEIIPAFQELARSIGKERVIWRYDPIFLSGRYTPDYHAQAFGGIAKRLCGHTERCVVSFLDFYRNTRSNMQGLGLLPMDENDMRAFAGRLCEIAAKYGIALETCAEKIDLSEYGIRHGHCVDAALFGRLGGKTLDIARDKNQRKECGCAASVDIGAYNTCANGCLYCYANYNPALVSKNRAAHEPDSPLLFGNIGPEDIIKERPIRLCKEEQIGLTD